MKLKQVVGSMFLLGLASASAFAADDSTQAQLDSMKAQIAKMEAAMNQNQPGGFQQADGWFNRITVSGQANVDGAYGTRSPVTFDNGVNGSKYVSDLFVQNANLYIDAQASDWTKVHVGLVYGQAANNFLPIKAGYYQGHHDIIDEAYVNIANFAKSPFYFKAGKQRVLFGDYTPYADITPSLTQLLSETTAVAATVGFVDASGVNGALYTFRGDNSNDLAGTGQTRVQNGGASLGFNHVGNNWGMKLGAQYLRNMADVNYINQSLNNSSFAPDYQRAVGGLAANASVTAAGFDASAKYVTALQKFNPANLAYEVNTSYNVLTGTTTYEPVGAKPAAWGVDVGYSFPVMGHTSRFGLGYQGSKQAEMLSMLSVSPTVYPSVAIDPVTTPKTRYLANYTVNVSKFTDLGFEVRNDRAYGTNDYGTGNNATTGTVRLSVKFA